MKKKLFGIGIVAVFASMFLASCAGDEDETPNKEHIVKVRVKK